MNERLRIPKIDVDDPEAFHHPGPIDKPAWVKTTDGKLGGIRCGKCGCWGASKGGHTVDANGNVNPSWLHEPLGRECGWHVFLTLEGWAE